MSRMVAYRSGRGGGITGRRCSFTLIELLVVVAVLAVLLSILLPALRNARESAKQIKCLSNERQIGLAFQIYASDRNGFFPGGWDGKRFWYQILNQDYRCPGDVFLCPSDRNALFDRFFMSYGMSNNLGEPNPYDPTLAPDFLIPRIAIIKEPARKILLGESFDPTDDFAPFPYAQARVIYFLVDMAYYGLNGRHRGLCNISWCDGHSSAASANVLNYDATYWYYYK